MEPPIDAAQPRIARREGRIAVVQLAVAAAVAVFGAVVRARIEPLPDGTSVIEAWLSSELWTGLFLYVVSYLLFAAAIGYTIGVVAVLAVLASGRIRSQRTLWLTLSPIVTAGIAVAIALFMA